MRRALDPSFFSSTLRPLDSIIDVPPARGGFVRLRPRVRLAPQGGRPWCWACVTSAIVNFYRGRDVLEPCRVANRYPPRDCCARPDGCNTEAALSNILDELRALEKPPHGVLPHRAPNHDAIRAQIEANRIVAVLTRRWDGHFVIVEAISRNRVGGVVRILDPERPAPQDVAWPPDDWAEWYATKPPRPGAEDIFPKEQVHG